MFKGSFVALITPFRNGAVDETAFQEFVAWQIEQGHARLGADRHDRRSADLEPRRAGAGHRAVRRGGEGQGPGHRRHRLQLDRADDRADPAGQSRPAPTPRWSSAPITTSRRRKGSISISRRCTTRSICRSSSTTFPAAASVDMTQRDDGAARQAAEHRRRQGRDQRSRPAAQDAGRDRRRFRAAVGRGRDRGRLSGAGRRRLHLGHRQCGAARSSPRCTRRGRRAISRPCAGSTSG